MQLSSLLAVEASKVRPQLPKVMTVAHFTRLNCHTLHGSRHPSKMEVLGGPDPAKTCIRLQACLKNGVLGAKTGQKCVTAVTVGTPGV